MRASGGRRSLPDGRARPLVNRRKILHPLSTRPELARNLILVSTTVSALK